MKTHKPMVSVIIPVFNGAPFISYAIDSVLNQTYKDFEVIVVDDGSTDDTRGILEPWIKKSVIQYIQQENKGLAAARNTGIKHAQGKYLKFLDCDDILYPDQLKLQVEHLTDGSSLMISATGYELEFENKNKISIQLHLKQNQIAQFMGGNPCPVHTLLVSREMVEGAGGYDEDLKSNEDSDLWLRILIKGGRIEKLNTIGCCYRIRGGALSADTKQMFLSHCKFSEKLNSSLLMGLFQLDREVLRQLYWANMNLIHKSFANGIKPQDTLPVTLKVNMMLYSKRAVRANPWGLKFISFENIARKQYQKICRTDAQYPEKLLKTAWRDERFYMRQDPTYLEVEPPNIKSKNVLYVNSSSVMYGAETRLLDIIMNLDSDKFRPFGLLPHPGPLGERLKGLQVVTSYIDYGFTMRPLGRSTIKRFLKINRDFMRLVRRYDIDVIHANLHINLGKFCLALFILRKPLIIHMRSHFWLRAFEKFLVCKAFKAIFISKFVEREFLKERRFQFMMSRRPDHSEILHDGIDVNHFSPQPNPPGKIRSELKINPQDFLVGMIGAIDKVKGQDLLLQAASIIVKKHPQTKFVIVGDLYHHSKSNLSYREGLLKYIKDFNLSQNVIFTGVRADINLFMNEIDLLVQPSKHEALGTSMVEAMSCGKPVIGTNVDGIPEVIGNNEGGALLDPRTPEAFAEAINYFIENPDEARKRGLQGRQRVLKLFNAALNIKRIENIYDQALKHQW